MRKRSLVLASFTAAAVLGASAPAYAHECFIENRSERGNAGATNSKVWETGTVEDFANSPDFPPGVDPECFVDYWLGNGGPEGFTFRIDKTIGAGSSNPNLGNGKGLEHIEAAYGELFFGALSFCALPE